MTDVSSKQNTDETLPAATEATAGVTSIREGANETVKSDKLPTISALICTRNRGASLVPTVRSILRPDSPCTEVVIIDQSPGDETEAALAPFRDDPRLRYVRTTTRGVSIARNIALATASCEICAFTDDDCEVDATWPLAHQQIFARFPQVALSYGSVLAVEHDYSKGLIPAYRVAQDRLCTSMREILVRGMGANMAVRREAALAIGGFDPELGPGSRFHACEDGDITVRCLLAGHHIYETTASSVDHYGFRNWSQARALMRVSCFGIGVSFIKPIKCGRREVIPLLFGELWNHCVLPSLNATLHFKKKMGWGKTVSCVHGIICGLRNPIDKERLIYRPAPPNHANSIPISGTK